MNLTLDTSGTIPIYQQIAEQIHRRVALGALLPGDSVPSVRQLALELTINPNTVARAYLELEYQGILHKRQGQGTFVSPDAPEASRKEGGRMVAALLDRAVADAVIFGIGGGELVSLLHTALRNTVSKTEAIR